LHVFSQLGEGGRSHVVFEYNAVFAVLAQVAFRLELVDSVKPVVAPALVHFELRGVDAIHHLRGPLLVYQLYAVFVRLRPWGRVP
jgi:hypothetical protein